MMRISNQRYKTKARNNTRRFLAKLLPFLAVLVFCQYVLSHLSQPNDESKRLLPAEKSYDEGENKNDFRVGSRTTIEGAHDHLDQAFAERRQQLRDQFHQMQSLHKKQPHISHKPPQLPSSVTTIELGPATKLDDRIIYFLHVHKSAGSAMCIAARVNGLNVADTNCNVQRDQRCCGSNNTFEAQQLFAMTTQYEFVANEREMYHPMDTDHYRYVVTFRRSQERYLSHWKHVVRWHYPTFQTSFPTWWKAQPDNWNFRMICGSKCKKVPKFRLTKKLFEYTLKRLDLFEDILLFEQFNTSFARFARNVGWTKMPVSTGSKKNVTYPSSEGKWDPMMSVLDDALYEVALSRYENLTSHSFSHTTRNAMGSYFASDKGKKCTSPCCAIMCSQY